MFFLIYLALTARILGSTGPEDLRRHAEDDDEGVALILILAALAVVVSVTAIFLVLNADASSFAARGLALVSLPLGWATIHTLAAFHYAHLHYRGGAPGLRFPGKGDPDAWDFLYASFTIGMTAQVSDVEVATRPLRRAVLVHGVASFLLQHLYPGAGGECGGDGRAIGADLFEDIGPEPSRLRPGIVENSGARQIWRAQEKS